MTSGSFHFGRYFATSSSSVSLPSSTSIMMAVEVTGFVIEAMLKMVSLAIGVFLSVLLRPNASLNRTPSLLTTATATPGTSPRSVASLRKVDNAAVPCGGMDGAAARTVTNRRASRQASRFMGPHPTRREDRPERRLRQDIGRGGEGQRLDRRPAQDRRPGPKLGRFHGKSEAINA